MQKKKPTTTKKKDRKNALVFVSDISWHISAFY